MQFLFATSSIPSLPSYQLVTEQNTFTCGSLMACTQAELFSREAARVNPKSQLAS